MKKPDTPQLEALEALLAEKRKHEGYLAKLEERRAGTPEHVFVRLRDEYQTKLMDAQVRAHAEAEALENGLEVDQAAVAEVESRLAALEEERVEGELREAVGELDSKEWQKRLVALNAGISMATKEREALTSSAERVRALLAEARGEPAMQQAAPVAEPVSAKPAPRTSAAAPIANAPNFDELAFLNSVVGRTSSPVIPIALPQAVAPRPSTPVEPSSAQPAGRPSTPPPLPPVVPPAPRVSVPLAPLKEAPSVKEPTSAPKPEPVSAPKPEPSGAPQLALGTTAAPVVPEPVSAPIPVPPVVPIASPAPVVSAATASASIPAEPVDPEDDEPPSALGRATARSSQVIKTLKCGECGSMNYPTEWYCERCGGELAAL